CRTGRTGVQGAGKELAERDDAGDACDRKRQPDRSHGLEALPHRQEMMGVNRAALLVCFVCAAPLARAENWPAWRGPSANGISGETNLPVRWSKTDNIAWRLALPASSGSTAIVWDDHVFLSVAEGSDLFL